MTYQANWSDQQEGASFVSTAVSQLDSELSDINRAVNHLIANWESEAQQAYHARQQKWNGSADNIKAALNSFVAGLNKSADISSGTEHTNVGVVSG